MVAGVDGSGLEVQPVDGPDVRVFVPVDLFPIVRVDPHVPQLVHLPFDKNNDKKNSTRKVECQSTVQLYPVAKKS